MAFYPSLRVEGDVMSRETKAMSEESDTRLDIARLSSAELAVAKIRDAFDLHHVTFHLGYTPIGPLDAPYVKSTYPAEWLTRYLIKRYLTIDPVVQEGFQRRVAFDWTEIEVAPDVLPFLEDALAHDVGLNGYSIPTVDGENRRSLTSITSNKNREEWDSFISANVDELQRLALELHRMAIAELFGTDHPFPRLTRREIECLALAARGNDGNVIAHLLGISESTVRSYLKSIRQKLSCASITEAVAKATQYRVILWSQIAETRQ
ncbi:LuxR family transcriptional regulator [Chelativorans sp. AA-79]|uniref:LuxR family transcriptional regulator n=1 Tax=Chelativorans sp. AA-79 TaxID=3028735 RepID=UPI0023F7812E|nr:LuxR family transcriptional regulator [Chelativorans sp. AA-79]WEX07517.1 LuxR family transcriptional regulator [Chelativorans sp. AA-79]